MQRILSYSSVWVMACLTGMIYMTASFGVNADGTTDSIVHASKEWPSFGRDYSNQRFSPLVQVSKTNVNQLAEAWHHKSGISASFQATPIVASGVMYLSLP